MLKLESENGKKFVENMLAQQGKNLKHLGLRCNFCIIETHTNKETVILVAQFLINDIII